MLIQIGHKIQKYRYKVDVRRCHVGEADAALRTESHGHLLSAENAVADPAAYQ